MDIATGRIGYTKNAPLEMIIDDGIKTARENGCDAFDYKVGEVDGYEIRVVMEPKDKSFESVIIDGVDGFGYSMAFDKD